MEKSEAFWEGRIRHLAKSQGLPYPRAFAFNQLDPAHPLHVEILEANHLGKPILVFILDEKNWSAIATQGISGKSDGSSVSAHHADIVEFQGFDDVRAGRESKRYLERLPVILEDGSMRVFKAPHGTSFFAFWNICLKMSQMWRWQKSKG